MSITRRVFASLAVTAGVTVGLGAAHLAAQEEFPNQQINVITHAGPGGGTDITTRMMMLRARRELKQDMVVVNKRGGSGAAALAYLADQEPDGHVIMTMTQSHIFNILQGKSPLGIDDISGLARATLDPQIVVVKADSPLRSLDDLITASNDADGGLKWGTTFAGGADHVAIHNFTKAAEGIPYTIVPFEGGGAIVTNLVGGNVDAALLNYAEGEAQFEAGELRALAVLADARIESLADTPTAKEAGVDNTAATIRGFVTLTDVPEEHRAILADKLVKAMSHGVYQGYLATGGMAGSSVVGADEWTAHIKKIHDDSRAALEELGML